MPFPELDLALAPEQLALSGAVFALLVALLAARVKHKQLLRLRREHLASAGQHQEALESIQQKLAALTREVAAGREDLNAGLCALRDAPGQVLKASQELAATASPSPFDLAFTLIKSGVPEAEVVRRAGVDAETVELLVHLHRPKPASPRPPPVDLAPPSA